MNTTDMNTTDMNTTDMNTELGVTRLTGEIRDAAHLHGVMAHLTAVGVEPISAAPVAQFNQPPPTTRPERNETS